MKFLSVIIPVFNNRRYLREAVLSAKHPGVEIVVVDDASTDECLETIEDLPGLKIVKLPKNRGGAAAQNEGVKAAKGKWVTILDSDDRIAPGSLDWRIRWARAHPDQNIVGGLPAGLIDEEGNVVRDFTNLLLPVKQLTLDYYQRGGHYPVANWNYLFRRDFIKQIRTSVT